MLSDKLRKARDNLIPTCAPQTFYCPVCGKRVEWEVGEMQTVQWDGKEVLDVSMVPVGHDAHPETEVEVSLSMRIK
jgi:hypothetical protein